MAAGEVCLPAGEDFVSVPAGPAGTDGQALDVLHGLERGLAAAAADVVAVLQSRAPMQKGLVITRPFVYGNCRLLLNPTSLRPPLWKPPRAFKYQRST